MPRHRLRFLAALSRNGAAGGEKGVRQRPDGDALVTASPSVRTRTLVLFVAALLTLPALCSEALYRYGLSLLQIQRPHTTLSATVAEAAWVALRQQGPRE